MSRFHKIPLSYKLNRKNVNKLINESDAEVQDTVTKIIKATKHISYEKFITLLIRNIKAAIANGYITNNIMYVYIPYLFDEHKSNFWLLEFIINFLEITYPNIKVTLLNLIEDIVNMHDITVFIIDDCIYSGSQIANEILDDFDYDAIDTHTQSINNIKIFFLISFMSEAGRKHVITTFEDHPLFKTCLHVWPKYIEIIEPADKYVSHRELTKLYKYYDVVFGEHDILYPVYFDHKLADTASTLTELYLGIVPNETNRKLITEYRNLKNDTLLKKLIIYPLISNCDNVTIDNLQHHLDSPTCPSPPYKKANAKFMKDTLSNKTVRHMSLSKSRFKKLHLSPYIRSLDRSRNKSPDSISITPSVKMNSPNQITSPKSPSKNKRSSSVSSPKTAAKLQKVQ